MRELMFYRLNWRMSRAFGSLSSAKGQHELLYSVRYQVRIVHLAGGQTSYFRIGLLQNLFWCEPTV